MSHYGRDHQVPVMSSRKRKGQDVENGDRFCTFCGELIRGQASDLIQSCRKGSCRQPVPYMSEMWKFSNGWGRCTEAFCLVMLSDRMDYCYMCGFPNEAARKEKNRKLEMKLKEEKEKAQREKAAYQARVASLELAVKEKDEVIQSLDAEYFGDRNLPVLELNPSENDLSSVNDADEPADVDESAGADPTKAP